MSDVNTGSDAGTTESTSEIVEGQAAPAETKAEIKAMKELFKYTIDGEDVEEEVDLSDKEGLRKRLQMAHASNKRMGEAKAAKSKAFEIIKAFEEDPANVFKRLGPKGREAAEKFLLEQIQDEMMSPEEKSLRQERAELAELRAEKAKAKEDAEKSEMSVKEKKYADDYQNTIISALEKSGLPKSPKLVADVARLLSKNLDLGLDLDADDLAKIIRDERGGDLKAISKDMTGEQLLATYGDEIAKKMMMAYTKQLRETQEKVFTPKAAQGNGVKAGERVAMSMEEWKEQINQRVK